jgi:AcrR family transcriptional regulator
MTFQKEQAAGGTSKGAETRARILDAAATLFADRGFEATTFAMIGNASGTAIGSIVHCFRDKADLAKTIYASAMDRLVSAVARAVDRHPTDIPRTINAAISACFSWATSYPGDSTLLRALHGQAGPNELIGERARLQPLIAAWAQPLIRADLLRPLAPEQLYAVIIAPAFCGAVALASQSDGQAKPEIEWEAVLSAAALAAIQPRNVKSRPVKPTHGDVGTTPPPPDVRVPPPQGILL